MKFVSFSLPHSSSIEFGFVHDEKVYAFSEIISLTGFSAKGLNSLQSYLESLPGSHANAQELIKNADLQAMKALPVDEVKLHSPLPLPKALIDFALTPQHLKNSAQTFLKREYRGLKRIIATQVMKKKVKSMTQSVNFSYYKGNHHAVIGHSDEMGWPAYTSYLDIEPELAVVVGAGEDQIAGYMIFNDVSARDVQVPELSALSLTRSKDFDRSNGLGPYFVPADEIPDPLNIAVEVRIGERYTWKGNTSEYSLKPVDVLGYLKAIHPLVPGTIVGLGTIPFCCGLDNDLWIEPGETVAITFDGLGTLIQRVPEKPIIREKTRWEERIL